MQYKLRVGTLKHTLDALHVPRSRVKENKVRFLLGTGGMTTQPGDTVSVEKDNPEVAVASNETVVQRDKIIELSPLGSFREVFSGTASLHGTVTFDAGVLRDDHPKTVVH